MDAMKEALNRKRSKITITVDDPNDLAVVDSGGNEFHVAPGRSGADVSDNTEMEALAEGDAGDTEEGEEYPGGEGVPTDEKGPPSSEKDMRDNPDLAPGVYDKDEESDSDEDDMAPKIFDKGEMMRRKADGSTKPRGLTDRAGLAAFKGSRK